MKVLIIGHGSMGQRRAAICEALGHQVVLHDPPKGLEATPFPWQADAAFICTPPADHIRSMGDTCEALNIPTFVEKPFVLPERIGTAKTVVAYAVGKGIPLMVGHNIFWNEGWRRFREQVGLMHEFGGGPLVYKGMWANNIRNVLKGRTDTYQLHPDGGGVLLDCIQDVAITIDAVGPLMRPQSIVWPDRASLDATGHMQCLVRLEFDYLRPQRMRRHEAYNGDTLAVWEGGDKAASDASYQAETEAFLRWVATGNKPSILPDPFSSLEVVRDATA